MLTAENSATALEGTEFIVIMAANLAQYLTR